MTLMVSGYYKAALKVIPQTHFQITAISKIVLKDVLVAGNCA